MKKINTQLSLAKKGGDLKVEERLNLLNETENLVGVQRMPKKPKKAPNWNGGVTRLQNRVLVYSPNHPNAHKKVGYVLRSRLVVERHLGRYLTKDEIVHHKNKNRSDDRLENLEITTYKDHVHFHGNERYWKIIKNGGWSLFGRVCAKCKKRSSKHFGRGLCMKCYVKLQWHGGLEKYPIYRNRKI